MQNIINNSDSRCVILERAISMKIKTTLADIILEIMTLAALAGPLIYVLAAWSSIPDKIPMHYNFAGEIDRWGNKGEMIFLIIIPWLLYLPITLIEHFPQIWNTGVEVTEKNRVPVYRTLKYMVKTLKFSIALIFACLILITTSGMPLPGWFLPAVIILEFGNMIFWLVRLFRFSSK